MSMQVSSVLKHPMSNPESHQPANKMPRSTSIALLIKRAHGLVLELTEPALAAHDLTVTEYIILVSLRDATTRTPTGICAEYRHNGGAMTRVCDRLVGRGLLNRYRDTMDRRKVNLHLTPAGRDIVERMIPAFDNILNTAIGNFSGQEVHELTRLLAKFAANLARELDPPRR